VILIARVPVPVGGSTSRAAQVNGNEAGAVRVKLDPPAFVATLCDPQDAVLSLAVIPSPTDSVSA
jgi:hypothetical protein